MIKSYQTPGGYSWQLCDSLLDEPHVLIGGTTGSGKSVLLDSLLFSALVHSPAVAQFVFIDLKKVELIAYKRLPHALAYADTPRAAYDALNAVNSVINRRYAQLQAANIKRFNGNQIYVIIDELADLIQTAPQAVPLLVRLCRLGRAANVHLIAATQSPNRRVILAELQQNLTAAVALRCRSSIESRQIIGVKGAETLPRYGLGYLWNSNGLSLHEIPLTNGDDLAERINFWENA